MLKKNFLLITLQAIVICAFVAIAAGSGNDAQSDYDAGYKIGEGIGTLINN